MFVLVSIGGGDNNTHLYPSLLNCSSLVAVWAEELTGLLDCQRSETPKAGVRAQARVPQGLVPDLPCLLPRIPADLCRRKIKGTVRNTRIDVHAAAVPVGLDVILHMRWLRILTEDRVVVRSSGDFIEPRAPPFFRSPAPINQSL